MSAHCTLVVLAWNGWPLTQRALDTLLATDLADATVLVVDNGSDDATAAELAAYRDRVRVLRLPDNAGFVGGNNAGIAAAEPNSDIVLLNNDLEFTQHDWLTRLRASAASHARVGIVGCRLRRADGTLQHAGSRVLPDRCEAVQIASGREERDIGQYAGGDRDVQGVVFAVAYIKRAVIDAIGPLHADYDTYFEDSDYCLRAHAAGWTTRLCGSVTIVHHLHGSTVSDASRRTRLHANGQATFARHWREPLQHAYRHTLGWQSALEFPPRYAETSRPLLRALDRAGIDVRYASIYRDALPSALHESGQSHDYVLNTLRSRSMPALPAITVACAEPELFARTRGRRRIGYGGFDTAQFDDAQRRAWRTPEELWVPSPWHRDALVDAGVCAPITVVASGVDIDYFHPAIERVASPHGEFVVLLVAAWDDIDQPWVAIDAFVDAFRRHDPVRLLCCIDAAGVDLAAATRALAVDPHGGRVSYLRADLVPEYQRGVIFASADAFVSASRSRWRVDAVLRAMATGLPVVAPRAAALADVFDDTTGYPIVARDDANGLPVIDRDALVDRLRALIADRAEGAARGARATRRVRVERGWDATAATIARRLDERIDAPVNDVPRAPARATVTRGVVVLGMHRSGTSCVAGLLQMMGLYGGAAHEYLHQPAENARGFFERGDLHLACVRALRARRGDWSIPLCWDEAAVPASRAVLRRDVAAIVQELRSHGDWFVKEPRLCLLLPEVLDVVEAPVLVHVVRAPAAVVRSIVARDGLTPPHALALWEAYNLAALSVTRGRPCVRVDYDALVVAPAATVRALQDALSAHGVTGLRPLQAAEAAAWIAPGLDHHGAADDGALPAPIAALWRALRDDASGDDVRSSLSEDSAVLLQQLATEHHEAMQREGR